jgi:hypothetical protein
MGVSRDEIVENIVAAMSSMLREQSTDFEDDDDYRQTL